jgi:hypothetical protein
MALWVATAASCADPTAVLVDGVRAELAGAGLEVHNLRAEAIYYFATERRRAAYIDWAPCVGPAPCPRIDPDGSAMVPYSVLGWTSDSSEALLYWWQMTRVGGEGMAVDSIRTILVRR